MATIISRKYEVLCELGQGSMGTVYKVRHTILDTIFALKVLPAHLNNPEMIQRFYREARVMARLNHPNIVRVLDIAHDDTVSHYFVMEYIQGKTLRQHLQERGPLPLPEVLGIARQVARALEYAHGRTPSVIHRDIKPNNILIEDTSGRVAVTGFGIAQELYDTEMAKSGGVVETLRFCAPEQLRHEPLDGRADIYALGMVLYEAHTGVQFFAGLGEAKITGQVLDESREHELRFPQSTPRAFTALLSKATAKARDKRYPGMTEFLRDLEACCSDLDDTKTTVVPAPPIGESRREDPQGDLQRVEHARQEMEKARAEAERYGAKEKARTFYKRGVALQVQADKLWEQRAYPQAGQVYSEARSVFEDARALAYRTIHQEEAEAAQEQLMAAQEQAVSEGAEAVAPQAFQEAARLKQRAAEALGAEEFTQARDLFHEARRQYELAQQQVQTGRQHQHALATWHKLEEARRQTVGQSAQERWPEAQSLEVAAEKAWNAQDYHRAQEIYTPQVDQKYGWIQREAEQEQARQAVLAAQQQAFAARVEAEREEAQRYAAHLFGQGRAAQERAEQNKQTQEWSVAVRDYSQAQELFAQAVQEARRERVRQVAVAAEREQLQRQAAVENVAQNNEERTRSLLSLDPEFDVNVDGDGDRWVIGEEELEPAVPHRRVSRRLVWFLSLAVLGIVGGLVMLPAFPPPLILRRAEPPEEVVRVHEGKTQRFVAEAAGTAPLLYEWTLDGQLVSREREWSYRPLLSEGNSAPKTVAVRISDRSRQQIKKYWRVLVLPNEPPRVTAFQPTQENVELAVGATQEFHLEAVDPEYGSLTYEWTVNGEVVGTQPRLIWKVPDEGRHQIRGMVRNPIGLTAAQEWQVVALAPPPQEPLPPKNTPPQIVQRFPDQPVLTVQEGGKIDFSVAATDPEGEELNYIWSINDKKVAQGDHFPFQASTPGAHRVDLAVMDQGGLGDRVSWVVKVEPPPPAPRLVTFTPHQARFSLLSSQSRWLGVEVEVPGVVEPTLRYEWRVNGRPVQGRELYEFKNQPLGVHQVEVTVTTPSGASISRHWTVEVHEEGGGDGSPRWSPRLELFDVKDVVSTLDQKQITVTGKVRNIDERSTENIIVRITALDKNDQPLLSRTGLPVPQSLAPDEVAVFRVPMANLAAIHRFHVEVISK